MQLKVADLTKSSVIFRKGRSGFQPFIINQLLNRTSGTGTSCWGGGVAIATIGLYGPCLGRRSGNTECVGHHKLKIVWPSRHHVTAFWPTLCLRTDALYHKLDVGLQLLFCRVSSQSDLLKPTSSCPQPLLSFICRPGDWMGGTG